MSNTVIQIKRSTATATPPNGSLAAGEQAYSYTSNTLFIGTPDGTGVIAVGGKYYLDTITSAFAAANAAYTAANTGLGLGAAFGQANTARDHANSAYSFANTAFSKGFMVLTNTSTVLDGSTGNVWGGSFNSNLRDTYAGIYNPNTTTGLFTFASGGASVMSVQVDGSIFVGEGYTSDALGVLPSYGGWIVASSGIKSVNNISAGVDLQATANVIVGSYAVFPDNTSQNTAYTTAVIEQANTARSHANAAFLQANAAYNEANTKLSLSGGTITGNLAITGSLSIAGNTYVIDAENIRVSDPLIYLAANNYTSDIVDIGFIGNYVNATGSNVHTGLYREHEDKEYYLFQGYDGEPINNHIAAFSNNMTLAVLNADLKTSNLVLGGANAILTIGAAFNHANAAHASANAGMAIANGAFNTANDALDSASAGQSTANAAFARANAAIATANAAFDKANSATDIGSAAFASANAGQATANASYAFANSAHAIANLAFTHANGAYALANSATAQAANADFLTTGTVGSARISGSYTGITGVGTITAGTWNGSTIGVPYGGTGMVSFTTNGILYGNSAGDIKVTAAGTEGQVLQASSSGIPQFAMLDGGTF